MSVSREEVERKLDAIEEHYGDYISVEIIRDFINQPPQLSEKNQEITGLNQVSNEEALDILFKFSYSQDRIDLVSARWLRKQLGKKLETPQLSTDSQANETYLESSRVEEALEYFKGLVKIMQEDISANTKEIEYITIIEH